MSESVTDARDDDWRLGENYTVERWTDDSRDENGHLIWTDGAPATPAEWDRLTMVCVDYDPEGEGDYRNLPVDPARPLDPPGADSSPYGPEPYDIDDLVSGWRVISP